MESDKKYKLTPKGMIVVGLGGMRNLKLAEELYSHMLDYMLSNNLALYAIDGQIEFVDLV